MLDEIKLTPTDPVFFARCDACAEVRNGLAQPQYFAKAYTSFQWRDKPKCDNCKGELTLLFRLRNERRKNRRSK